MKRITAIILASATISGCSPEIDYAEVSTRNGLFYKYGETTPFTGTILNTSAGLPITNQPCISKVEKGRYNGKTECFNGDTKIYYLEFFNGIKNGRETAFNPETGEKIAEQNWKDGRLDGLAEHFLNGTLIHQQEYKNGQMHGTEKRWSDNGNTLITELHWSNGDRHTGFETLTGGQFRYLDGKLHGKQITYSKTSGGKEYIHLETHQKNGVLDGLSKKYNSTFGTDSIQQVFEITYKDGVALSGWYRQFDLDGNFIQEINLIRSRDGKDTGVFSEYPSTLVPDGLIKTINHRYEVNGEELWVDGIKEKYSHILFAGTSFYIRSTDNPYDEYKSVSQIEYDSYHSSYSSSAQPLETHTIATSITPSSSETCVDGWITAYRNEAGKEAMVVSEQLQEWESWCNEGKTP